MKKIVIEAYALENPYVGLGEFCRQLGLALAARAEALRADHGIELYFMLPSKLKGCFGNQVHYISIPMFLKSFFRYYPFKVHLFHTPHQYCKFKRLIRAEKKLLTIHDVNFIYEKKGMGLSRAIRRLARKINLVDYINYISYFAQQDTRRYFDTDVPERVIYNGVTDLTAEALAPPSFSNQLPKEYFFHISSLLPKKNVALLIRMMKYLPNEHLVIAGDWQSSYSAELRKLIAGLPVQNVITLDNVSEAEKSYLYAHCKAFFFPSLCEGFGLPPIEAMKFGKPVFLSTLTSLPEVGGDVACYWNDLNPEKMARQVSEAFNDSSGLINPAAIKQHAGQFRWDQCAEEYIRYYLDILKDIPE